MSNKKASVIADWLPLMLIIVVLLCVLLFASLGEFGKEKTVQQYVAEKIQIRDAHDILSNYLKSPLDLNGFPQANIADGIASYSIKEDAQMLQKIQASTDEFFSKSSLETDYSLYSLEISYAGKEFVVESEKSRTQMSTRKLLSETAIPMPYNNGVIQIKLFIVTITFAS